MISCLQREKLELEKLEMLRVSGAGVTTDLPSVAFGSEAAKAARALAAKVPWPSFEANR